MQVPASRTTNDSKSPLAGFYALYEASLRAERKSPKTIKIYKHVLGRFLKWFEATYQQPAMLSDFSREQVRLFLADLMQQSKWEGHPMLDGINRDGLAGGTIHQFTRSLKTFGSWLEREEYTDVHPLAKLRLPRVEQKEIVPLTEEEERLMVDAYDQNVPSDCRVKAILLLMLDTGLRLSEVVNLKFQNVDFEQDFLLVMGKGRKERAIPFGFTTERVMRSYSKRFRPYPALPSVDEFFLSPDGYPMTANSMKMLFVRIRQRTGIKRLHAHLLRHTYGIRAQEQGMPTLTLQHYMGHTSSKVTERYTHAAQSERLKRARGYSPIDQLRLKVERAK